MKTGLAQRIVHGLGLVLFLVCLGTIVSFQWWMSSVADERENRRLAERPDWPADARQLRGFPVRFADYMDDNFGLRSSLLRWHNRLMIELGVSPSRQVLLGRDGWLFFTNQELTHQNRGALPLSEEELSTYVSRFRERREWVEALGIPYVAMVVPDKNSVYPEYLPASVRKVGPSRYRQFVDAMAEAGEPLVDALPSLLRQKVQDQHLYWMTDTHWTCLGAWFAYQDLMDAVEPLGLSGAHRVSRDDLWFRQLEDVPGRDMAKNMLQLEDVLRDDRGMRCRYKQQRDLVSTNTDTGERAGNPYRPYPQHQHRRYAPAKGESRTRVLVYRDSFANAMLAHLLSSFDEVVVVPRVELDFDVSFIERYRPNLVVYQFVERALYWEPAPIQKEPRLEEHRLTGSR